MNKIIIISMFVSLITGIFGNSGTPVKSPAEDRNVEGALVQNENQITLDYKTGDLGVVWAFVDDPRKLTLHLNLEDKKTAASAKEELGCKLLVNGGFYNKEDKAIGLFVTGGKTLNNWQENNLFNGVFGITSKGEVKIGTQIDGFEIAIQTGPVLVKDGVHKELAIKNDEPERRVVVGTVTGEKLVFLSFYNPSSYYLGPNLEDLPFLLKSFEKQTGLEIQDAINLDGGTASAFYNEEISLTELRAIGSFFCASSK